VFVTSPHEIRSDAAHKALAKLADDIQKLEYDDPSQPRQGKKRFFKQGIEHF
jgi:hypothetical protein